MVADSTCTEVTKSQMWSLDSLPLPRYSRFYTKSVKNVRKQAHTCMASVLAI
jgi:hypothetical protein